MGLLHTATSANMIVDQDLTVSYSRKLIYGKWHWWNLLNVEGDIYKAWEYKRFAKKSYRYVGLDYVSACSIAAQLVENYTREYYISRVASASEATFERVSGGVRCQTQVSVQKTVGHIYEIVVSIDEEDAAYSFSPAAPQTMFVPEDARRYDY